MPILLGRPAAPRVRALNCENILKTKYCCCCDRIFSFGDRPSIVRPSCFSMQEVPDVAVAAAAEAVAEAAE